MLRLGAKLARRVCGIVIITFVLTNSVGAQSPFDPIIRVNGTVITQFEVDDRARFLTLLNAPGDPELLARQQLIEAEIQEGTARLNGFFASEEQLEAGLNNFASQGDLTAEEFIEVLALNGVGAETFRSFIRTGIVWREYVRARFANEARDLPDSLIARELTRSGTEGGTRVLLSEIVLPAGTPETRVASLSRAEELASLTDPTDFAAAARGFSVSPTRVNGGERPWIAIENLPEEIVSLINSLEPGNATKPLELGETIQIYFLRDREIIPAGAPDTLNVDYVLLQTDGDEKAANRIVQQVDTCDDFYGLRRRATENALTREAVSANALPADVRNAIQNLDANETVILNRNGDAAVLMLCGRTIDAKSPIDFELVGTRLLNQRLTSLATHHLAELRAAAVIEELSN